MDPWDAAVEMPLGQYEQLLDAERIAVNVAMAYHEIDPDQWPVVSAIDGFTAMSRYVNTRLRH